MVQRPNSTRSDIYRDFKHSFSLLYSDLKSTYRFISKPIKKLSFSIKISYNGEYIPLTEYIIQKLEPVTSRIVNYSMFVNKSIAITVKRFNSLKDRLKTLLVKKLKRERKTKFKNSVQKFKTQFKKLSDKIGIKLEVKYERD